MKRKSYNEDTLDYSHAVCQQYMILLQSCVEYMAGHLCVETMTRFNIQSDILLLDLAKPRNRDIYIYNCTIALTLDRHLDSSAVDVPFKFQIDMIN